MRIPKTAGREQSIPVKTFGRKSVNDQTNRKKRKKKKYVVTSQVLVTGTVSLTTCIDGYLSAEPPL